MLLVLWAIVLFVFVFAKKELFDPDFKLFYSMMLVAAVIHPIVFTFSLWSRVVQYFSLAMVLILPNTVYRLSYKQGRKSAFLWNVGLMLLIIVWYLITNEEEQYIFMWQG